MQWVNFTGIIDDPQSIEVHMQGLQNEMKKAKPHDTSLLPLMKSTFGVRRSWVIEGDGETFGSILAKYPALSHMSIVSY